jgi:hypothetical protein
VYGTVDRVEFHCGGNVETGLLESQAKTARTGEEVDP